ncbi:MAG: hypothetical protein ACRDTV_12495 [Mycobacterium sp.]
MPDTFDQGAAALSALPLTQAVVAGATWTAEVGQPVVADEFLRKVIDALASLEQRVTALGG